MIGPEDVLEQHVDEVYRAVDLLEAALAYAEHAEDVDQSALAEAEAILDAVDLPDREVRVEVPEHLVPDGEVVLGEEGDSR